MNDAAKEATKAAKETASASRRERSREPWRKQKCPMRRIVRQGFQPGPERGLQSPPRGRFGIS
ncbi:hypothetical protein CR51_15955 [Caballeronia megalochromosomata]|jgi:hypothetical protein|nr:hypothetical protein CR51_15955 [Caballeronia megalochromosomata]